MGLCQEEVAGHVLGFERGQHVGHVADLGHDQRAEVVGFAELLQRFAKTISKQVTATWPMYSSSSSWLKLTFSSTVIFGLMRLLKKRRWRERAFMVNANAASSPARSSSSMPYRLCVRIFSGISAAS